MGISVFDLYSIGIGPSSSHTIGPMKAGFSFLNNYLAQYQNCDGVKVELFGSLALTGKGHCTDTAALLGLSGFEPETIHPEDTNKIISEIYAKKEIKLLNKKLVRFYPEKHLIFYYNDYLEHHANGIRFSLLQQNKLLFTKDYYSVGGGFIMDEDEIINSTNNNSVNKLQQKYPFSSGRELLNHCHKNNLSIAEIMMANELCWRTETEVKKKLMTIWQVMDASIERGLTTAGVLPGSLIVKRRANKFYNSLIKSHTSANDLNWLNAYAIAVNEENAAGGKIVTAPTNGAAGIIPAVLKYYLSTNPVSKEQHIIEYLLTGAAIGILFKKGASISAAEVGCQGEVGVACAMAAGGLCALLGGNSYDIENAAEMGMEHNLGLTCDPIGGLVQIPCIERNAMGAAQAVNAAKLALIADGEYVVSLDDVIKTMKETGLDMSDKYKETALGGLAVNLPAC